MTFFESLGRFFFEKNRAWLFLSILCAPFAIASLLLFSRFFDLREFETAFDNTALKARSSIEKRERKIRFFQRFDNCEPYFINQNLETLSLLQNELHMLQQLQGHPGCSYRGEVLRRIDFLNSPLNRLTFAEENVRSSKKVKETEEKLLNPVEIDTDDLSRLLSLIEGNPIARYEPNLHSPQLLIQDFLLSKKDPSVYKLNLAILKREFNLQNEKKN